MGLGRFSDVLPPPPPKPHKPVWREFKQVDGSIVAIDTVGRIFAYDGVKWVQLPPPPEGT